MTALLVLATNVSDVPGLATDDAEFPAGRAKGERVLGGEEARARVKGGLHGGSSAAGHMNKSWLGGTENQAGRRRGRRDRVVRFG